MGIAVTKAFRQPKKHPNTAIGVPVRRALTRQVDSTKVRTASGVIIRSILGGLQ